MIPIFPCGSRRSKKVLSGTGDFLRLLVRELGTPKLAQIFAYGKWLYPYIMLLHGASDLDQRCLKTHNSEDECSFLQISSHLPPKLSQSPILGTFQCETHSTESPPSVARYWSYDAETLRLYKCRQVLRVCQNFSARERLGCRAL